MERIVYFQDKTLIFTSDRSLVGSDAPLLSEEKAVEKTKVLKKSESCNRLVVPAADPAAAFARFAAGFAAVEAAGGIVADDAGRLLMIFRNGRWDLPKGHIDAGETPEACAVREIGEETGVAAELRVPLCATYHAYRFEPTGRRELKRTRWYLLRASAPAEPRPQREEGIERAVWCGREEAARNLDGSYPTIRRVFEALHGVRPDLF